MIKNVKVASPSEKMKLSSHDRDYVNTFEEYPEHLLKLSYLELERKNLEIKQERLKGVTSGSMKEKFLQYLKEEEGIKAVTVCFTDLEGHFHTLDYDKKYILRSYDNLTFDGSSIKGFTAQKESDLRLYVDWSSFRWMPYDLFGAGKVLVFANVCDKDGSTYISDFRSRLYELSSELSGKGITINVAPEIEGFIFEGVKAEQVFDEKVGFTLATMSGYFSSLPRDILRKFIDKFAEVQRALGFENEKDHPEVAPAQFELNFKYSVALDAADQIQLYKLLARQVADSMGLTACFLPKPVQGLNGSGMHTNISLTQNDKNLFYDANKENFLSEQARAFMTGILYHANEFCLIINSSVNAYRRLDPHFEAPNEIKASPVDRGSMIRIPIGNEKSTRLEVRTVAPDCNPYLCVYSIVKAGMDGMNANKDVLKKMEDKVFKGKVKKLPGEIYTALEYFSKSDFMKSVMGEKSYQKYIELKERVAERCPKALGNKIKAEEILYHHEITNQLLWTDF